MRSRHILYEYQSFMLHVLRHAADQRWSTEHILSEREGKGQFAPAAKSQKPCGGRKGARTFLHRPVSLVYGTRFTRWPMPLASGWRGVSPESCGCP